MIFIYTTCKNEKEAQKIVKALLNKKLVVCANWWPSNACYEWKGKICSEKEIILILKTKNQNYSKIKTEIKKLHSYDTPIIAKIKIEDVNKDYLKWLENTLPKGTT
ncbi:MAG: divalent-cation tolerance protein CutA [Patescibacteria group bacterium]